MAYGVLPLGLRSVGAVDLCLKRSRRPFSCRSGEFLRRAGLSPVRAENGAELDRVRITCPAVCSFNYASSTDVSFQGILCGFASESTCDGTCHCVNFRFCTGGSNECANNHSGIFCNRCCVNWRFRQRGRRVVVGIIGVLSQSVPICVVEGRLLCHFFDSVCRCLVYSYIAGGGGIAHFLRFALPPSRMSALREQSGSDPNGTTVYAKKPNCNRRISICSFALFISCTVRRKNDWNSRCSCVPLPSETFVRGSPRRALSVGAIRKRPRSH